MPEVSTIGPESGPLQRPFLPLVFPDDEAHERGLLADTSGMDWLGAIWCFGMSAGAWFTRKKQDEWAPRWIRERGRLDPHYYERATTWVAIGTFLTGLFFMGHALELF